MRWIDIGGQTGAWNTLEVYRERYELEDQLGEIERLRRSIERRHGKWLTLRNRIEELETALEEAQERLAAVEGEVAGARRVGELLIERVVDQAKTVAGEAWSPVPILGFRLWTLGLAGLSGARRHWATPVMTARCLNQVPGEDLPHSQDRCGPPACGVYATKDLPTLLTEFSLSAMAGAVLGLVELTGKVIEHARGYRAATATVRALAGWTPDGMFASDAPNQIEAIFAGTVPLPCVERVDPVRASTQALQQWKEERELWTWEPRFES